MSTRCSLVYVLKGAACFFLRVFYPEFRIPVSKIILIQTARDDNWRKTGGQYDPAFSSFLYGITTLHHFLGLRSLSNLEWCNECSPGPHLSQKSKRGQENVPERYLSSNLTIT